MAALGGAPAPAAGRRLAASQAPRQEAQLTAYGILLLLALGALALLWLMKLRGAILTLAAAALAFGGAGYALQGRPDLGGQPRAAAGRSPPLPLTGARQAMMGQFDYSDTWLNLADSLASRGRTAEAAQLLGAQVARRPERL